MNQDTLVLVVRCIALLLVLVIAYTIWQLFQRAADEDYEHPKYRGSALDKDAALPPNEQDGWDIQRTKALNKGFFGNDLSIPSADELSGAPTADLPIAIMARMGQHFSGEDLQSLVSTFGLTRSSSGIYELINQNGRDILFSMLNIHAPGTFAAELEDMAPIEGVLLVMQLPNGSDAVESFETFAAMANDMCEHTGGRICDFQRKPLSPKDLLLYRTAAEQFQQQYNSWLAEHQRKRRS